MSSKTTTVFRYIAYAIEITVAFILGATPGLLPELFGAKPSLLLCVALTAALFEREIPAMVIGMICGVLMDLGYSNGIGFFAITLTILCFFVGYVANNLVMATFPIFLLYAVIAISVIYFLYFLIFFLWSGVEESWLYFRSHILSRMIQTYVFAIVYYFLNRLIHAVLGEDN